MVRWDRPTLGPVSPELFIGIAQERGLIGTLGEGLLRDACKFALRTDIPWVAVNVSSVQFRNENFAGLVKLILDELGLPSGNLHLEITEGVLLTNPEVTEATLKRLRAYGVRVALDDFRTGLFDELSSSLHGRQAQDRPVLRAAARGVRDSDSLVRAMIGLARTMRMEVTAEGVETSEQRQHLSDMGYHELQGSLMSRPVSEDQLLALLSGQVEETIQLRGGLAVPA